MERSMELGSMVTKSKAAMATQETEFEAVEFPPRLSAAVNLEADVSSVSATPLDGARFATFFDCDGRLVDEHALREAVFRGADADTESTQPSLNHLDMALLETGGVDPDVRPDVWRFLFELYPFTSTKREREVILAELHAKYTALKHRWKEMLESEYEENEKILSPSYLRNVPMLCSVMSPPTQSDDIQQQWMFMQLQASVYVGRQKTDKTSLLNSVRIIDKDVPRTDRDEEYFKGDNPHLHVLRDVLLTYSAFQPMVGYAQGMNDIVSRFLSVLDSEVEAYWCFTNFMEHVKADFVEDGVLNKLKSVGKLLRGLDPDLLAYLDMLGVSDLTFCHRWMLLSYKREFPKEEAMKCFEILSSRHLELSSAEAQKSREEERRRNFAELGGTTRLEESPMTPDAEFTFDVFMCVAILIHNRQHIFSCQDTSEVFQFICGLSHKLSLSDVLRRAEVLFHQYCQRSVVDCFHMVDLPSPDIKKSGKLIPKQKKTT